MAVKFVEITTGDANLDRVQQNIANAINDLQTQQATPGIAVISANYALQSTDTYVIVNATADIVITLGKPSSPRNAVIIANTTKAKVSARTGDVSTNIDVPAGTSTTLVNTGSLWVKI